MVQLSKIINTVLISRIGLYLNIISQVYSVILMRKAHEDLLHQNLFVFPLKKKLIRKKLKLLQQRKSASNQENDGTSLGEVVSGSRI